MSKLIFKSTQWLIGCYFLVEYLFSLLCSVLFLCKLYQKASQKNLSCKVAFHLFILWPEWLRSWIRAAQFSRSGRPKGGNLESCGGNNTRTRLGPSHIYRPDAALFGRPQRVGQKQPKAGAKRRTSHVPNLMLMLMSKFYCSTSTSFALDSAHVKFDFRPGPKACFKRRATVVLVKLGSTVARLRLDLVSDAEF